MKNILSSITHIIGIFILVSVEFLYQILVQFRSVASSEEEEKPQKKPNFLDSSESSEENQEKIDFLRSEKDKITTILTKEDLKEPEMSKETIVSDEKSEIKESTESDEDTTDGNRMKKAKSAIAGIFSKMKPENSRNLGISEKPEKTKTSGNPEKSKSAENPEKPSGSENSENLKITEKPKEENDEFFNISSEISPTLLGNVTKKRVQNVKRRPPSRQKLKESILVEIEDKPDVAKVDEEEQKPQAKAQGLTQGNVLLINELKGKLTKDTKKSKPPEDQNSQERSSQQASFSEDFKLHQSVNSATEKIQNEISKPKFTSQISAELAERFEKSSPETEKIQNSAEISKPKFASQISAELAERFDKSSKDSAEISTDKPKLTSQISAELAERFGKSKEPGMIKSPEISANMKSESAGPQLTEGLADVRSAFELPDSQPNERSVEVKLADEQPVESSKTAQPRVFTQPEKPTKVKSTDSSTTVLSPERSSNVKPAETYPTEKTTKVKSADSQPSKVSANSSERSTDAQPTKDSSADSQQAGVSANSNKGDPTIVLPPERSTEVKSADSKSGTKPKKAPTTLFEDSSDEDLFRVPSTQSKPSFVDVSSSEEDLFAPKKKLSGLQKPSLFDSEDSDSDLDDLFKANKSKN